MLSPPVSRCSAALALVLVFCGSVPVAAQDEPPLSADRPGFGTGTATVARSQVEGGYTYADLGAVEQQQIGQILVRIPLILQWEFRLGLNSYIIEDRDGVRDTEATGFEDANVAVKTTLSDGAETFNLLRPAAAFLLSSTLPTGADAFGTGSLQPQALLALAWPLPNGFGLGADVNVSSLDAGEERSTEIAGGATLSYGFGPQLGAFVELYGFAPEDAEDAVYLDGGFTYLLSNDIQLDVNGGVGLTDGANDYFAGFGIAWRLGG